MNTKEEESILLSLFEKHKGYNCNLFDNEEWREFDAFKEGFYCCYNRFLETGTDLPKLF